MLRRNGGKFYGLKATSAPPSKCDDQIHAYLQLIMMKEGKVKNTSNILQFAWWQHIKQPNQLTMEELKNVLQFAHIHNAN
jgi:hypothetical protein